MHQHWHTASSIQGGIDPQPNIKNGYSDIPANATRFLWDGMRLAAEIEPGLSRSYVVHPDQPYTLLARCDSACSDGVAQAGGRILWFHTNPLGTPEALADHDGTLRWQSQYRAWGELDAAQGGEHQPLRFPEQYHDSESGLHYNTFRYYDPETGRYLSPDPIGLAGGLNLYSYVPDPNGWMDPWGWAVIVKLVVASMMKSYAAFCSAFSLTSTTSAVVDFSGLRCTIFVLSQLRVAPDQRCGWAARAAS